MTYYDQIAFKLKSLQIYLIPEDAEVLVFRKLLCVSQVYVAVSHG